LNTRKVKSFLARDQDLVAQLADYAEKTAQTEALIAAIYGVVGRDGGFTREAADACVVIPPLYPDHITPHTEGQCAVIWHLLVSHPALQIAQTKWESVVESPA
jgi:hypothetical protein